MYDAAHPASSFVSNALIKNLRFSAGCTTNVARLSQGDPRWAENKYDHSDSFTIRQKGCALTSLAIALNFAGDVSYPDTLNKFMANNDSDYYGLSVNWDAVTRDYALAATQLLPGLPYLKFFYTAINSVDNLDAAKEYLNNSLCQGHPVIVGVNLDEINTPSHFVIVTGQKENDYTITDPGYSKTLLSQYSNQFVTRGYVADPSSDISGLNLAIGEVSKSW